MEITLGQGILLTIVAVIAGIDAYMEGFFIFRPIIVGTVTGLILGDLQLGIISGGLTELAYTGLTPVGGTQPPNPVIAGIMGPVLAHISGISPLAAVPLTLPFALLMQYLILFYYSSFSFFMPRADKAAANADIAGLQRIHYQTIGIVGISYAVIVFLSTYLAQAQMLALVAAMPAWLSHGFEVAGGILPAVGFALLLRVIFKTEFAPYLIIGILFSTFIKTDNLLPVALLGCAFAMYGYFKDLELVKLKTDGLSYANMEGEQEDGI
ncbi:MAG: PTS galactosamine transporter subunit IIC [Culicoidibacterales bacterium]